MGNYFQCKSQNTQRNTLQIFGNQYQYAKWIKTCKFFMTSFFFINITCIHMLHISEKISGYLHHTSLNPLWPSDAIWHCISGSTLAQVMACCLMAPSHYLNQCWLSIKMVLWYSPILQEVLKISIHQISLKDTFAKLLPHLPGANALIKSQMVWTGPKSACIRIILAYFCHIMAFLLDNWYSS